MEDESKRNAQSSHGSSHSNTDAFPADFDPMDHPSDALMPDDGDWDANAPTTPASDDESERASHKEQWKNHPDDEADGKKLLMDSLISGGTDLSFEDFLKHAKDLPRVANTARRELDNDTEGQQTTSRTNEAAIAFGTLKKRDTASSGMISTMESIPEASAEVSPEGSDAEDGASERVVHPK